MYEEGRFCHAINDHDNDFYILLKESTTTRIRLVAFSGGRTSAQCFLRIVAYFGKTVLVRAEFARIGESLFTVFASLT